MSKSSTKEDKSHSSKLNQDWKGGKHADTYSGGNGNDKIRGGGGDDTLAGGNGKDTFIFEKTRAANGFDTILDFTAANKSNTQADLLDLSYAITAKQVNAQTIGNYAWIVNGKLFVDPTGGGIQGGKGQQWANLNGLLDGDVINLRTACFTGTIKASALAAPPLALLNDSGSSASDKITNDAAIVQPQGMTGTVEYSLDGVNWTSTYTPPSIDGTYTLQARQSLSGQTSPITTLTFTLDTDADVSDDLAVTFDDSNIDASEQENILLTVTGLDDDVDLSGVTVTVTDSSGNTADATYDAAKTKWVVNGSTLVDGPLTASVSVTDIAGNTANGTPDKGLLADSPEVLGKQSFNYTENRKANSFIGSVDATSIIGISGFRFWDPLTKTYGTTSADGFFTIDSAGKIWMTALGATSFANDAEDTQDVSGPTNTHRYFIQASDTDGDWSKPVEVTLNEGSCRCDDPDLQYLIDFAGSGNVNRTLKDGRIYSVTLDEFYNEIWTDLGPVDLGKQIVRMTSTGGTDVETNNVTLTISLADPVNANDPSAFLDDLACINLQASKRAELLINSSQGMDGNGDPMLLDNFLPSLEKVFASTQMTDSAQYAASSLTFYNYGSYAWLPNLKDITVLGGGDSARLTIYNYGIENYTLPGDTFRGDDFMSALETIHMESYGTVDLNIKNALGDAFMKSLSSITALGGSSGYGHTTLSFDSTAGSGNGIPGDDGYTDGYMTALEVVTAKHQFGNAKIQFHNGTSGPAGADNYMNNLTLVDIYSTTQEALSFNNGGGVNYMGSLTAVNMTHSTNKAFFTAINTSRMDDSTQMLRTADDFMTGLKSINITSGGAADFVMRNKGGEYFLNDDYSTPYYSKTGDNFMSSLETIRLDASANLGAVKFEMLVDVVENPTALTAMKSMHILGGEIKAMLDTSLEAADWFDFANIQGVSDGQTDNHFLDGNWTENLIVLAGFDTGTVEDVIQLSQWNGTNVNGLEDLVITTEGDNVRIRYEESLGYEGSIVILGAASTFSASDNILV